MKIILELWANKDTNIPWTQINAIEGKTYLLTNLCMSFNQIRGVIINNEIKNLWNCTIEFREYLRLLTFVYI